MANIRIDLNHTPLNGETVSFKAPCNASDITGLAVYYVDAGGATVSREFTLNDANGNDIGEIDNIFAEGAIVKVILDTDTNSAFVQNPDTNAYLEGELAKKYSPDNKPAPADIGAAASSHNQAASTITAGTLAGQVKANATAAETLGTAQVRDIYAGTSDMTAGSSSLTTGALYFVYE